jgi:acyl carrier protein
MSQNWNSAVIHETILGTLGADRKTRPAVIAEGDDVFSVYGMNSLETFRAIVKLEKAFGIEIGEQPSEFERVRTFAGLKLLVAEKLAAGEVEDVAQVGRS